jgi:hypothetical protein
MKYIFLFLSIAVLIIGVHQTLVFGFEASYWIFMFCIAFLFIYKLMANNEKEKAAKTAKPTKTARKRRAKRGSHKK